jgi:hypothetical protein
MAVTALVFYAPVGVLGFRLAQPTAVPPDRLNQIAIPN